jgi:hypothetical protein
MSKFRFYVLFVALLGCAASSAEAQVSGRFAATPHCPASAKAGNVSATGNHGGVIRNTGRTAQTVQVEIVLTDQLGAQFREVYPYTIGPRSSARFNKRSAIAHYYMAGWTIVVVATTGFAGGSPISHYCKFNVGP